MGGTPAQRLEADRAKFPAMQVDEILVWRNWLTQNQQNYDRFQYNVLLGLNVDPGPDFPDYVRQAAIQTRSLRIDAVGWKGDQPTIFEVKRRAGPENVGQLLVYLHMWRAQSMSAADPILALVCSALTGHIVPAVQASGIQLYVVPTSFSFLSPHAAKRNPPQS